MPLPKTYRIDIVDESTGQTLTSVPGIPEARMHQILEILGRVGRVARDVREAKGGLDALKRLMGGEK